jgi:hypothetical protein
MEYDIADIQHKCMIIKINRSIHERESVYEAVRKYWVIDIKRAEQADYVLAVANKIIIDVFVADKWYPSTVKPKRKEFVGTTADEDIRNLYVGKMIPEQYRKIGNQSPVLYTYEK